MMLCKPIVSLIVVFAAASSAAASAAPMRRGDGGYPPPYTAPTPMNQCSATNQQCCNTYTSSNNPTALGLAALVAAVLNANVPVGIGCSILSGSCSTNQVCCTKVYQNGLINTGCSPLIE